MKMAIFLFVAVTLKLSYLIPNIRCSIRYLSTSVYGNVKSNDSQPGCHDHELVLKVLPNNCLFVFVS